MKHNCDIELFYAMLYIGKTGLLKYNAWESTGK